MNLLKLPDEMREFLVGLQDPKDIRKYSERKLRHGALAVGENFFVDRIN